MMLAAATARFRASWRRQAVELLRALAPIRNEDEWRASIVATLGAGGAPPTD